jgi:hypothetical protein
MEMRKPEQQGCEEKSKMPFQALLWLQVKQIFPEEKGIIVSHNAIFHLNCYVDYDSISW